MDKIYEALGGLKSRKMIVAVIGIVTGILTQLKELGIDIDPGVLIPGIVLAMVYIFQEAEVDIARTKKAMMEQVGKWKDKAFWVTVVGSVLGPVMLYFGVKGYVVWIVNLALSLVIGKILKKRKKQLKAGK